MTWRHVTWIYLVLVALALAVVVDQRVKDSAPVVAEGAPEKSLLGVDATVIEEIAFRRGVTIVRASRDGERWRVIEPAAKEIPPDLIAAAVGTLTAGQVSEVVAEAPGSELGAFGLTEPDFSVRAVIGGQRRRVIQVFVGANNPTNTAVYAKRDDRPEVFLVGLNLRYYAELMFDAAG